MQQWETLGELQEGIEAFVRLFGRASMLDICRHTAKHGVERFQTIHTVHALRDAGRLVQLHPEDGTYGFVFQLPKEGQ